MKKLTALFIILLITDIYAYKQYTNRQIQPTGEVKVVATLQPQPTPTSEPEGKSGLASWYDRRVCTNKTYGRDCKTANGDIFDDTKNTIACTNRFRLGDHIRICYMDKCIDTICTDRGNFERLGRTFDLSVSAFRSLADIDRGVIKVKYEVIQ